MILMKKLRFTEAFGPVILHVNTESSFELDPSNPFLFLKWSHGTFSASEDGIIFHLMDISVFPQLHKVPLGMSIF